MGESVPVPNAKPLPAYAKAGKTNYVCVQRTEAPVCRLLARPAEASGPTGDALVEFVTEVNSFFALRAAHMLQRLRRDLEDADLTLALRLGPSGLTPVVLPKPPREPAHLEVA